MTTQKTKTVKKATDLVKTFKRVFETEDGQEILHHLSRQANFLQPTWDPRQGVSPNQIFIEEGKRSLFLYIVTMLEKKPQQMLENYRRQTQKEKQYEENF